jgi:hypothetical protein
MHRISKENKEFFLEKLQKAAQQCSELLGFHSQQEKN